MQFLVFLLVSINTWQHQYIDKYTYNTSSYIIGIFENSRYHPFNSEGSPLLHPVANSNYKGSMRKHYVLQYTSCDCSILSNITYFH